MALPLSFLSFSMSVTAVFVSTVHVVSSVYHMRGRVRVNFTLFARDHMNCLAVAVKGSTICWNLFLDSGFWILESGIWILDSGIWNLDSGFWNLLDKHMHSRQRAQMLASYPGLRLLTPAFVACSTKPLAEMEELEKVGLFILGVRRFTLKGCIFPNWELYLVRRVCD